MFRRPFNGSWNNIVKHMESKIYFYFIRISTTGIYPYNIVESVCINSETIGHHTLYIYIYIYIVNNLAVYMDEYMTINIFTNMIQLNCQYWIKGYGGYFGESNCIPCMNVLGILQFNHHYATTSPKFDESPPEPLKNNIYVFMYYI